MKTVTLKRVEFDSGQGIYPGGNVKGPGEDVIVNTDLVTHIDPEKDKRGKKFFVIHFVNKSQVSVFAIPEEWGL